MNLLFRERMLQLCTAYRARRRWVALLDSTTERQWFSSSMIDMMLMMTRLHLPRVMKMLWLLAFQFTEFNHTRIIREEKEMVLLLHRHPRLRGTMWWQWHRQHLKIRTTLIATITTTTTTIIIITMPTTSLIIIITAMMTLIIMMCNSVTSTTICTTMSIKKKQTKKQDVRGGEENERGQNLHASSPTHRQHVHTHIHTYTCIHDDQWLGSPEPG